MKALIKEAGRVQLVEVSRPLLRRPDDVLVEVRIAGICRTDLFVADGAIASADPITLGHELCGRVIAGALPIGTRVTADPRIEGGFLGVTRHGAFADAVVVPAANLHVLPDSLDPRLGAYVEPVAAALAVPALGTFTREARIAVFGDNRFAHLIERVLRIEGFAATRITGPIEAGSIDVGVETSATAEELAILAAAVGPGGQLIVKSRMPEPLVLPTLAVHRAAYGSFSRAIELLASGALDVADLLGEVFPLARHADAFARARAGETHKLFLRPGT